MNILQRALATIVRPFGFTLQGGYRGNWPTGGAWIEAAGGVQAAGPDAAMRLAAYFACLRVVSEDVAKLPVRVYRKQDGRREYLEQHQAYRLLARMPNPYMTAVGFREAMTHWGMAWGNAFAEIQRDPRGGVAALIPIHPGYVTIETETPAGEPLIFYRVTGKRGMRILFEEEMFHLRNIGDGIIGYNVAALATNSIGLTSSANQYASTFFNSGGRPAGLLSVTESLSAEGRDRLREELKRVHGGADNTNKILVLDQGMTFVPFGVPPETSQMLETRRYQTEEICRWFRVPSHKVGERDGITYGAMEQMEISYANDSLGPWLARWEQEAVRKLLTPAERDTISIAHDLQGTLKGTHKDRADYMMKLFQIGGLTIDEVRSLNDRDPLPEGLGESAYVQTNMAPVGMSPTPPVEQEPADDNQPPSEEVNEDDSQSQL